MMKHTQKINVRRSLCALALLLIGSATARAEPRTFTSPIDITGTKLQLHLAVPQRDTQARVDVRLPTNLLPPEQRKIFDTPLSTQVDQYWSVTPDKKTGMTPRQAVCDGPDGLQQKVADVNKKLPGGVRLV